MRRATRTRPRPSCKVVGAALGSGASMAHIVPFRVTGARRAGEAEPCRTGAQIVIVPGVRRERHAEPLADLPGGGEHPQRDTERDWLELAENLPTACQ